MLKFMMELCNFEFGNALLEFGCFADSMVDPDSAVLQISSEDQVC